ncbi:MAG TPA: FABP family protein [Acidimicrobiales bacterium]|nr:FABP family protein [Acidimicrobiales bacterium]
MEPALHPLCEPLRPLLGTWRGSGHGSYPTIVSFDYTEEITFSHVGKPFVSYVQRTKLAATGMPAHAESGYLRAVGNDEYEFVISSPTGLVEVDRVVVTGGEGLSIEVTADAVHRTPSAKPVTAIVRRIAIEGDILRYDVSMAAMGLALTHHLQAELRRSVEPTAP